MLDPTRVSNSAANLAGTSRTTRVSTMLFESCWSPLTLLTDLTTAGVLCSILLPLSLPKKFLQVFRRDCQFPKPVAVQPRTLCGCSRKHGQVDMGLYALGWYS